MTMRLNLCTPLVHAGRVGTNPDGVRWAPRYPLDVPRGRTCPGMSDFR